MESFRYSENPKETLRAIFQKAARNIPPTKPASLVKKDPKDPKDLKNLEDSKEILEKVNVDDILKAWASQKIQFVLELIGKKNAICKKDIFKKPLPSQMQITLIA